MNNKIILDTLDVRVKLDKLGYQFIYPRAYFKNNYFVYLDNKFKVCYIKKDVEMAEMYNFLIGFKR